MSEQDAGSAAELQKLAFPPPFPPEFHWKPEHLAQHVTTFPRGQFVATVGDLVVGSCSNCIVSEETWNGHLNWNRTIGGPFMLNHDANGTTLYGVDITVHPDYRKIGIGRALYQRRFELVRELGLRRYGTACRIPDYLPVSNEVTKEDYAQDVLAGRRNDRTMTPFSHFGMTYLHIIEKYMDDEESGDAAALWEWKP